MDLYAELHAKYEALESQSPAPIPKATRSIATQTGKEAIQSEDILALEITENTPAPQITNANNNNTENTPPPQITNTMASTGAVDEIEMKSAISADSTGITTPTPTITTTTTDPNSNSNSSGPTLEFGEPPEPHLHDATPEQVIGYHGFTNLAELTELPVPLLVCDVFFLYIF